MVSEPSIASESFISDLKREKKIEKDDREGFKPSKHVFGLPE